MKYVFNTIAKRLLTAIPTLLIVSIIGFALVNAAPGDSLSELTQDSRISKQAVERMREQYGLNEPLWKRYLTWLKGAVKGDLGISMSERLPVRTLLADRMWNTLKLALSAALIALLAGIAMGTLAARYSGGWLDRVLGWFTVLSISTPRIVLGIIALVIAARTGLFPIGDVHSMNAPKDWSMTAMLDSIQHLVLPALVLSLPLIAVYLRQTRNGLLQTLNADFIRTARAKGLSEGRVIGKHAARVAAGPVITLSGYVVAALLGGSVLVETVMSWPGIGALAVNATRTRDVPVMMSVLMLTVALMILGNLIADLVLVWADPRIAREDAR